jgi:beta-lactamase class C
MKRYYRIATAFTLLLLLALARSGAAAPANDESFYDIVKNAETTYLGNGTPGIMIVYVGESNGHVQTDYVASGTAGPPGSSETITGATVFEIGSITKTFTATLMEIALARTGKKDKLDTPAGPMLAPYGVTPSATFNTITLGQLASHSAGLPKQGVGGQYSDALFQDGTPDTPIKNFWTNWMSPPGPEPGSCYQYSNSGSVTLGFAASQLLVPGTTSHYDAQLTQDVTDPLAMYCTDGNLSHISCKTVAKGTILHKDGTKITVDTNAADLKSDAVDMQYWLDAQLGIDSGRGPIPQELKDAIAATHAVTTFAPCANLEGKPVPMALGWNVTDLDPRHPRQGILYVKNGATSRGAMSAALAFSVDHHAGIAVLTNAVQAAEEEREDSNGNGGPADTQDPATPQALANELLRTWIGRGLQ